MIVVVVVVAVGAVVRSSSSRLVFVFRMFSFVTDSQAFGLALERKLLVLLQNSGINKKIIFLTIVLYTIQLYISPGGEG